MNYMEPEVITIIEGPPPEIQTSQELWSFSLWEGTTPRSLGVCQMRTFKGSSMIQRCAGAWRAGRAVRLDFPQRDGLRKQVDVLAARTDTTPEGDVLFLWVVAPLGEEIEPEESEDADENDDPGSFA
jgi:hypothetical protein